MTSRPRPRCYRCTRLARQRDRIAIVDTGIRRPQELMLSYRNGIPVSPAEATWTQDNQALVGGAGRLIISVRPEDFSAIKVTAPGN